MALKMTSIAELLLCGGVGGELNRKPSVDAGLHLPTGEVFAFPLTLMVPDGGEVKNHGGEHQSQYPCGFPDALPTDPTIPTDSYQHRTKLLTDPAIGKRLGAAYHLHHFNCMTCIASGRGERYGKRCGKGAALWTAYANTDKRDNDHEPQN